MEKWISNLKFYCSRSEFGNPKNMRWLSNICNSSARVSNNLCCALQAPVVRYINTTKNKVKSLETDLPDFVVCDDGLSKTVDGGNGEGGLKSNSIRKPGMTQVTDCLLKVKIKEKH